MKTVVGTSVLVVIALALAGCASVPAYRSVDLGADLSAADVARYQQEARAAGPQHCAGGMAELENSNWWPLGILIYWRQGNVMQTAPVEGHPLFHVSASTGYGPLALLYAGGTHATFDETGRRLTEMRMGSLLAGCLAMVHATDVQLPGGTWQHMTSWHLFHHLLGIHVMDGHVTVSLFTAPNPVEVSFHPQSHAEPPPP